MQDVVVFIKAICQYLQLNETFSLPVCKCNINTQTYIRINIYVNVYMVVAYVHTSTYKLTYLCARVQDAGACCTPLWPRELSSNVLARLCNNRLAAFSYERSATFVCMFDINT